MTPPHAVDSLLGITVTASGMALTMLDILGKGKGKIERKNLWPDMRVRGGGLLYLRQSRFTKYVKYRKVSVQE